MGLWTQRHAGSIVVLQLCPVLEQLEPRYSKDIILTEVNFPGLYILSLSKHLSRCTVSTCVYIILSGYSALHCG